MTRPPTSIWSRIGKREAAVTFPLSSAAAAVISLNVEPGS
jgi:hypothetical protein